MSNETFKDYKGDVKIKPDSDREHRYTESEVDIPTSVELIRPHGEWGRSAHTYGGVWKTWEDERPCPTWNEIEDAYDEVVATRIDPKEELVIQDLISRKILDMAKKELKKEGKIPEDY